MKHADIYLLLMLSFFSSRIILADEPTLADANKLFGFAETAGPKLFFPPVQTQKVKQAALIGSLAISQPQTHTQQSTLTGRDHFLQAASIYQVKTLKKTRFMSIP